MNYRRSYHTLTVLADGKVLATGGQTTTDGVDETTGVLGTEIWDPDTDVWTPTASHRRPRLYHSTALLLPDARVLLAGGGAFGNAKNEKSAEIYSPPYLFKGARPTITTAPTALSYGQSFNVGTPDAARIRSVSLVRMGSVTHNLDMDQRFMTLGVQTQSGSVTVDGPANANVAPPGFYMVFLIDQNGVPSVSKIVKVEQGGDQTPPSVPGGVTATPGQSSALVNWSQSTDNVGVTEYRVHRSTTSGFTPSAANRVATVTSGTSYNDTGLTPGTYYYRVVAADAAGNASTASSQVSAVITADTTAPDVSISAPAAGAALSGTTTLTATASDDVGVQSVQFRVDGNNVGAADTTSPYSLALDTTTLSQRQPRQHRSRRTWRVDAAGNSAPSGTTSGPQRGSTCSSGATTGAADQSLLALDTATLRAAPTPQRGGA